MGWCQVFLFPDVFEPLSIDLIVYQINWRTGLNDVASVFRADEASATCHSRVIVGSWCPNIWQARDTYHFHSHLKSLLPLYHHCYVSPLPPAYSRRKPRNRSLIDYISPSTPGTSSLGLQEAYDTLIDGLPSDKVRGLGHEMGRWRAIKSVHEQAVMRKAADLSGDAHTKVSSLVLTSHTIFFSSIMQTMRFGNLRSSLPEASLAAHIEYLCMLGGAERMAYVPVVASGLFFVSVSNALSLILTLQGKCTYNPLHI